MLAQMILAAETLLAYVAHMLLQPRVYCLDMTPQIGLVMELLGTYITLVRLVLRAMTPQVGGVHLLGLETFAALLATEWILTGMEALVVLRQVTVFGELLVALQALDPPRWQCGRVRRC